MHKLAGSIAIVFLACALAHNATAEPAASPPPSPGWMLPGAHVDAPTDGPGVVDPFANGVDFEALSQIAAITFKAAANGQWGIVAVIGLILAVSAFRKWGGARWPFWKTDPGSAFLVLILGVGGAALHGLAAGVPFSWKLIATGLAFGFAAAGGFATIVRILPWVIEKLPLPLAPVLGPVLRAILAVIGSSRAKADALAKAEAAGDRAVSASPGTGVAGILGGK